MMRIDLGVGYIMTGIFMVAMLVIGAELLFANGASIADEEGLVTLSDPIRERFGAVASSLFLLGFWAAATSSITGAWNGGAYLFGDLVRSIRRVPEEEGEEYLSEKGILFRAFLVWITFPPMLLLLLGEPVLIVIAYASLGALFMPFLAITLLWLLNRRVTREYRNGLLSNIILGVSVLLFIYVGIQEVLDAI
jgi:Mn2+/Fe2+ NRAMP family transporter